MGPRTVLDGCASHWDSIPRPSSPSRIVIPTFNTDKYINTSLTHSMNPEFEVKIEFGINHTMQNIYN